VFGAHLVLQQHFCRWTALLVLRKKRQEMTVNGKPKQPSRSPARTTALVALPCVYPLGFVAAGGSTYFVKTAGDEVSKLV
jgi:hypothetical protein